MTATHEPQTQPSAPSHAPQPRRSPRAMDESHVTALLQLATLPGGQRRAAMLLGISPGTVSRRLRRIRGRLQQPLVRQLRRDCDGLTLAQRQIAMDHLLYGRTLRELAAEHQTSVDGIRQTLAFVRGWHNARSQRQGARL